MKDRIKQIREHFGLSQAHFAQRIHKSPGFISLVESGRSDVSEETISAICSVLPVNKEWLLTGEGEMTSQAAVDKENIGIRIKQLRKDLELTQKEFAAATGYTNIQIHLVESGNIHQDKTIRPIYRFVPKHPVLNFYSRNKDGTSGGLKKSYGMVNSCSIEEKLSGECAVTIKLLTRQTEGAVSIYDRLEIEGLVFYITEVKKNISSGMCYTEMSGEHISYILNDDEYKVTAYDKQGKPKEILQELLLGTPFSVGTVDFEDEVTLRVNNDATRRACVMQLIALVGGEIEYYGYTIGIRKHVGSSTPVDVMNNSNVQDISYSYNVSEDTTNYSLSLYQKGKLELGDELSLRFEPLGIEAESRIVGMEWNPFNFKDVSITVGQYIPTLNDSLYQIATDIQDITQTTAKYTVEFGEVIGNGSFYFTRAYRDRPYFMVQTDDGSKPVIELTKSEGSAFGEYIGAKLSGVSSTTVTLVVFYCTIPVEDEK